MPVVINGSTGISGVDGSAGTPAVQGSDANTGVFFPAADTIAFAEGGVEAMRINSSAQVVLAAGTAALPAITTTGDTNTGIYFPGADRIGFTEGGAQAGEFDASGNFLFNSGYGSVAVAYGCRAWVNFNGTGVVAIRASGNVTAITDHGTGDYTVNFTTALPDVNYATNATSEGPVNTQHCIGFVASAIRNTYSTTAVAVGFFIVSNSATRADPTIASLSVFR